MTGMSNNSSNNNIFFTKDTCLETSSTNTGQHKDPNVIHRRRGEERVGAAGGHEAHRLANHQQQQYREEVSPNNHGNTAVNRKSSAGIRHKFPLLLCKSNKTGDGDAGPNPTSLTPPIPPATKSGHVLVQDDHAKHLVMSPSLPRVDSNMAMKTPSTRHEFDDYTSLHNRRKSLKPHLQLHVQTSYGADTDYGHSLESGPYQVKNNRISHNAPPIIAMHNATILQDRMLTSSTLELLCGSGRARSDPIKYNRGTGGGGYGGEDGTVSTWDDLSSSCAGRAPRSSAIAPGAVASKLGDVFAEEAAAAARLANITASSSSSVKRNGIVRGQEVFTTKELHRVQTFPMTESLLYEKNGTVPGGLEISQEPNGSSFATARARILSVQQQPTPGSKAAAATTATASSSSTATTADSSSPPTGISRSNSNISSGTNKTAKFCGGSHQQKKSAVQVSKEKLQKKWAMDRAQTHVKKTNWYVCKKTGTYRKKVAINFSTPEDFY
jgi:hypothetical protein